MTADTQRAHERLESYLATLRKELGSLPADDIEDIVRELRGHIGEQTAALDAAHSRAPLEQVLGRFGTAEQIASLYRADALVAHARATFAPALIIRATLRFATKTVVGFLAFLAGLLGYGVGVSLIACALLKPFIPAQVGLWIDPHGVLLGAQMPEPHGRELLGWWIIPYGLGVGAAFILGTTVLLRWMLRFVPRARSRTAELA